MKYTASDLRHRIEIYVKTRVADGGGGYTETYGPAIPPILLHAKVKPMSARERWASGQISSIERVLIVVRYHAGLNQSIRVVYWSPRLAWNQTTETWDEVPGSWDARTFEVTALIDVDERHQWLELDCEERFAG